MSDLRVVDKMCIDLCASWIMGLGVKGGQLEQSKHLSVSLKISLFGCHSTNIGTEDFHQTFTVMKFIHFSIISP